MRDMKIEEMSVDQIIGHLNMMFDWKRRPHEGKFLQTLFDKVKEQEGVIKELQTEKDRSAEPKETGIANMLECGACGASVMREEGYRFRHCPWCGVKIQW